MKVIKTNGDILKTDNTSMDNSEVPFGSAMEILLKPDEGYIHNGVVIKHGYLNNSEFIHSNRQWRLDTIPASQFVDNKFTIPAAYIDGDVEIKPEFITLSGINRLTFDPNLIIKTQKSMLNVTALLPAEVKVSDLTGRTYYQGYLTGIRTFNLHSGLYFVNRQKVIVP